LVTVPIILDQAVGYCSGYYGSGCWLLLPLFWIPLLVTVPVIFDQVVGECSGYFG
jgi:hydrogenase-4 membrane subunit HyfE